METLSFFETFFTFGVFHRIFFVSIGICVSVSRHTHGPEYHERAGSPEGRVYFFSVKCRMYRSLKVSRKTKVFACFCLPIKVKFHTSLTIAKLMLPNESEENIKR